MQSNLTFRWNIGANNDKDRRIDRLLQVIDSTVFLLHPMLIRHHAIRKLFEDFGFAQKELS
ncbi:hypothetical protein NQU17_12270 [Clostridiaceae bacterium HFYG-1003]|nr:hypothetical protein NQU17_12270 [Clostridiaceae bacterium HFYG-1003]